ncbi:ABC transporter substrate-binding protein [Synechococcus sp. BA-132 BA5]|uniref:ABC transporter substrate-binding protein n=1 Tax=Synechococcus sp. BA-132 BA5 TaxID=3110252 RepID=UPI002B1FC263|nr:ABC transporter substrate-binding protein [Synechococcus sp. BA-132 BA5]MEA5414388.1 ABC transporter substrate-binding protein [Synechococcus sp. BA-132 BA5]
MAIVTVTLQSQQIAIPVAIGIDLPLTPGAAIDPSDKNAADFYKEQNPSSPIEIYDSYNSPDPNQALNELEQAIEKGIQFFVNTQASSHAVQCLELFASDQALSINVSATSTRLSDRDDYFLRIVPDLEKEQSFIANEVARLKGKRLLVLQDTGNLAYSQPALEVFRQQLRNSSKWQLHVQRMLFTDYHPKQLLALMQQPWDGLYILGGAYQPSIGNMAQQFYQVNPKAPIVFTPWARSPAVLANAGEAANQVIQISPYLDASSDPALKRYLQSFKRRFGYEPHAMSIGTRQALELLDQAFAKGHRTPHAVKQYLLSKPVHSTSLGAIRFNRFGDNAGKYHSYGFTITPPNQSQGKP